MLGGSLIQCDWCFSKEWGRNKDMQKRSPWMMLVEIQVWWLRDKEGHGLQVNHQQLERRKDGFLLTDFGKSMTPLIPLFQIF